jgi:hypothetical protein
MRAITKILRVLARVLLGIVAAIALAAAALAIAWLIRRQDPTSFLSDRYVAYFQVPSIRAVYDQWLNLEAADTVLARPELSSYHRVVTDARGLALTTSWALRTLLDVPADVMLLRDGRLLAAVDLGWRGMLTPLARIAGPLLGIKGFSFLNDSGVPMYRYTTGSTTIHAALAANVAILSLDADVVKEALERRAARTGLDMKVSRELLGRMKLRSRTAVRVLADTQGLATGLFAGSAFGARALKAIQIPEKSMLDVEITDQSIGVAARSTIDVTLPELAAALGRKPSPIGVLRQVPAGATLLTVCNLAPLADLYKVAAAFQGKDVADIFARADAGARSVVGAGIEELLFSWIGAELGAFMLPGSREPVFFAAISDEGAYRRAMDTITGSIVASRDSSLVLDGVRVDRLEIPWYVALILDTLGVEAPNPYFISRGGFFFLSLDAANLAAIAVAADRGENLAQTARYAEATRGMRSDSTLFVWYDSERSSGAALPFFLRGTGILADLLRLYVSGAASVRLSAGEIQIDLGAQRGVVGGARLLPGFPVTPAGRITSTALAFRWKGEGGATMAWVRDRSTLVLADAGAAPTAEAAVGEDCLLLPEILDDRSVAALWAVSPDGTIYRFGPGLEQSAPFPLATGIVGPMPPGVLRGKLALFSKSDASLVLLGPDGERSTLLADVEAPLFALPDARAGMIAWYPKSFDAKVHLADAAGVEATGWPVQAAGISFCSPRIVADGESWVVSFLTQAGTLHLWDAAGAPRPGFPLQLPGVFYASAEPMSVEGRTVLVALAQDGSVSMVGLDGTVVRRALVPDLDGRTARILAADLDADGRQELLLHGSGAFIAGYDGELRALPGFPIKGAGEPQLADLDRDGGLDIVTVGLDGKIYAYTLARRKP